MLLNGEIRGSPTELAIKLLESSNEVQGSIYWITEDGKTLDYLNDKARRIGL